MITPDQSLKPDWDEDNIYHIAVHGIRPEKVQKLLDKTEAFKVPRPARHPVSLRLDPFDISLVKRLARKKGIPHTQLMAIWLHERIEQEKEVDSE